jgi:magnesium chelatase subunit D
VSPFDPAWTSDAGPSAVYAESVMAAALLAIDPGLGGIAIRAWPGPPRDAYLHNLKSLFPAGSPARKLPPSITDDRLLGGLDIAATLQAGRPVTAAGLLAESAGGILILAMAERLPPATAGRIAAALESGANIALLALDEGLDGEAPPKTLLDRLAFTIPEAALPDAASPWPEPAQIQAARTLLACIPATDDAIGQICTLSTLLGIASLRAPLFALRAARASAVLHNRHAIAPEDIVLAAKLVLAPRATQTPIPPEDAPDPPETPPDPQDSQQQDADKPVEDRIPETAKTILPPELLALLANTSPRRTTSGAGAAGATASQKRGRPAGARPGPLTGESRLSLLETLRAAAPWQPLRHKHPGQKLAIHKDDFRIRKFKEQPRSVAIFAVDASGSSAINRLAEAKGAIQLLLAECYVRRDQVALIAFRGRQAEALLPPTHALARARRALAALPGGGPTPLATGIDAARALADFERRAEKRPLLVLLTDGGANIARDGAPGRAAAAADALAAARACRAAGLAALVVDTAPRPQKFVASLAAEMGAKYLPLPYADPARLSRAVQAQGGKPARQL